MGFARQYDQVVDVPSIAADPTKMSEEKLWYKKEITLPQGDWTSLTLELKGARFRPEIYINNKLIAKQEGGMAPIFFLLKSPELKPGSTITLEIALASLKHVPQTDASYIPDADHWRSNVSSGLWDDVLLHWHGDTSITRIIPFVDFENKNINVTFDLKNEKTFLGNAKVEILDSKNKVLIHTEKAISGAHGSVNFSYKNKLKNWSPDHPNLYHLKLTISDHNNNISDQATIALGIKKIEVRDKQFYFNNQHLVVKGTATGFQRFVRTKEGRELAYDEEWFIKNILIRTKELGGNYLRFYLGVPPERFLDLCDKYGVLVQFEWSFFHAMPASKESLLLQYKSWLDLAMRHPSVSFIHPYNETMGDQLKTAWAALNELLVSYPPLLLAERDTLHLHKYWWSLFENLGIFYDDVNVFPLAVLADEFGGNYLDEKGDLGLYATVKESFMRFLGRTHTAEERLEFQAQSNGKIAEYWRRIGAAGFAPYCALGSDEDGSHWFLGPLKEGKPKPVWDALTAAFSPQSVSIELWDRNFTPKQILSLPVYVFNDEAEAASLKVKVTIENKAGTVFFSTPFTLKVNAFSKKIQQVSVTLPEQNGDYVVKAELLNKPKKITHRVISAWDFRVLTAQIPTKVASLTVAVPADEKELVAFLKAHSIKTVDLSDSSAHLILTSLSSWKKLASGDAGLSINLLSAIQSGKSVVMLDVGDRTLGQGYLTDTNDLGPLQGVMRVTNPKVNTYPLFGGISLKFTETGEPESFLHPTLTNSDLWNNIPLHYTRIFNGLRGGLIVPAADMEFSGLNAKAFTTQWKSRGAKEDKIITGPYYAYELQGFYEFSNKPNDVETQKRLKNRVAFLVQDAPALAISINPNTPIVMTDLTQEYKNSMKGLAENLIPLANSAKNLTQTPVALVDFGTGKGRLLVSQLLTSQRLAPGFGESGLYGIRYDEVAVQLVLNMISRATYTSH